MSDPVTQGSQYLLKLCSSEERKKLSLNWSLPKMVKSQQELPKNCIKWLYNVVILKQERKEPTQ